MTPTIFTVTGADLARLDPKQAIDFFAELLWAETRRVGIPTSHVAISTRINVPDGGVDASVDPSGIGSLGDSFIQAGQSAFQIKAGANFKPWQEHEIRTELLGDKPAAKENLGASVRACLDGEGSYTLVCTAIDLVPSQVQEATRHLQALLQSCGYPSPKVEVWGQSHLIGLIGRFPALALRLNGNAIGAYFQIHSIWSSQNEMRRTFKPGDPQETFITSLQKELRRNDQAVHVRIRGEPGVGKTRLALEATAADDLKPLVIYCDRPAMLLSGPLLADLLRPDLQYSVILVVDECDMESVTRLWNQLQHQGPRISLVSIYNDPDEPSGTTVTQDAPLLDTARIVDIIEEYGVPKDEAHRWAAFCDGSPRAAHVIGQNLRNNPDDILRQPDTVNVWDRYVAGSDDLNSEAVQQRRTVLQHLALFKRFGYSGPVIAEAKAVAGMIERANPLITWSRFQAIVKELRRRKILQGETTLYITPRLLHIKLWVDWWDIHGDGFGFEELANGLPPTLVDWFIEMFRYARESAAALKVTQGLLDENGPFGDPRFFGNRRAGRFFLALTDAAPEAALRSLQRTIGTWDVDQLLKFEEGRREVVWSLERIAVWRELFSGAAQILLKLAEAENERFGNNATGVFADLFLPGYGALASTEASPEERFPVLKTALESTSKKQREVALAACDHALAVHNFSRMVGAEHQGLRRPPQLWTPKLWGELFDAYRRVWNLLAQRLETLEADERDKALEIILTHVRELSQIKSLFEMVMGTLEALADRPYAKRRRIVEVVEEVLHYDGKGLAPEQNAQLEQLRARLVDTDFHARLERYVGMDLIHDAFDQEGNAVDKIRQPIESLAAEANRTPGLLAPELPWLVTEAAGNGYRFGRELALRDTNFALLAVLLDAQRQATEGASAFFLGGYLSIIFERDRELWEATLDQTAADAALQRLVPELTWRSGMTERAGLRILALAESGAIPLTALRMFAYGGVVRGIPEPVFERWIDCLLNAQTRATAASALSLLFFYYRMSGSHGPLPRSLTLRVLTAAPFFESSPEARHQSEEYEWSKVADAFLDLYPEDGTVIANKLLERFGEDKTITGSFHGQTQHVLTKIAKKSSGAIWKTITGYLGPPSDNTRAFHITRWLRDGGLTLMPPDQVWAWVDAEADRRARFAASFVPPILSDARDGTCWARELLVRYGERRDVRSSLQANFSTEVFTGPTSSHYAGRRQGFEELRKGETDANVRRWLDEFIDTLAGRIEDARVQEERDDF